MQSGVGQNTLESVDTVFQLTGFEHDMQGPSKVGDLYREVSLDISVELAKKIIRLSGLQINKELHPYGDIEIKLTRLMPSEKLYEELLFGDNIFETNNSMIILAE